MAKAKKEFKARVRKMQKHIKALQELAATDAQRVGLDNIQVEVNLLERYLDGEFDGPPPLARSDQARKDPQPASA